MTRRILTIVATLLTIGTVSAEDAHACSCFQSGPPCQATWSADAVFTGIVRSIETIDHPELGLPYQSRLVRFAVERAFRGVAAGLVDVVTGAHGAACGYDFQAGRRYLVYASKTSGSRLATGICSRTRRLEEADEDLRYLSSIPATSNGARIFGRVTQYERDPGEDLTVDYGPVEGLLVTVRGSGFVRDATTDRHGRYEIRGVPVGKAAVAVLPPPEYSPRGLELEIEISDPRACVQADFGVRHEARIAGLVVDSTGRPVQGVTVEAIAAEDAAAPRTTSHPRAKTDAAGRFEMLDLSPGDYVLGVGLTRPPAHDAPYPRTFYPGVAAPEDAAVVTVAAGEGRQLDALRLPEPLREYALGGCVEWPDGQPAAGVYVSLRHAPYGPQIGFPVQTDGRGCFSLKGYEGMAYTLATWASPDDPGSHFRAEAAVTISGPVPLIRLVLAPR